MQLARLASRAIVVTLVAMCAAESAASQPNRPPGSQPPGLPAPQGLTAKFSTSGVQLSWQRVTGAAQYQISRAPTDHDNMLQVGVVLDTTLKAGQPGAFTDANRQNSASMYYVQVYDKNGNRGGLARVQYTPPAAKAAETPLKTPATPQTKKPR